MCLHPSFDGWITLNCAGKSQELTHDRYEKESGNLRSSDLTRHKRQIADCLRQHKGASA
jgi:hypothetical protein